MARKPRSSTHRHQRRHVPRRSPLPWVIGGGLLVALIGLVIIFARSDSSTSTGASDQPSSAQVAQGAELYQTYCASCHGVELEGQPNWQQPLANGSYPAPPHDASGHTWHHPDSYLFNITKQGGQALLPADMVSGMPGFGNQLSDEQIKAILDYIKSTWPQDIRQMQAQRS